MPFSWFRVPANTSRKLKDCLAEENDHSKRGVDKCIRKIVVNGNGANVVGDILFEANGKFAHVHVEYADEEQRLNLILDLEADQAVDLLLADDIDDRIALRNPPES